MHCFNKHIKRALFFLFAMCLLFAGKSMAQNIHQLPPNQSEQDACNSLQLCGNSFNTPYSYTGTGRKLDLSASPCFSAPDGGEVNSVWLKINVLTAGSLVFKIMPVNHDDDYDFAVLNETGRDCNSLTSNDVVRCNFNNNSPGSNVNGVVGLSSTATTDFVQAGATGGSYCRAIDAKKDDTYLIMINNFGNYVSAGASEGFTIDFSGSTASFYNNAPPKLTSIDAPCNNATSIVVKTSTEILCNSIAADGSDFTTTAPVKIVSAAGVNCTNVGGYTNAVVINLSAPLPAGTYTINAQKGNDGNTLMNLCNDQLQLPAEAIRFIILPSGKATIDNESICYEKLPYIWNGISVTKGGDSAATYTTVSSGGCDSTILLNLKVSPAPKQINLTDTICEGDSYALPWDSTVTTAGSFIHRYINTNGCDSIIEKITINVIKPNNEIITTGFCRNAAVTLSIPTSFITYLWSTGNTNNSINVNSAGTYTVAATDNYGCITKDTFLVTAYTDPVASFTNPSMLCGNNTKSLDAGSGFKSYSWNNGGNTEVIVVDKPGKYWVSLTDVHDCTATDTVTVVPVPVPADFLVSTITKCFYDDVIITPLKFFKKYAWSDSSNFRTIKISTGGIYWLEATDANTCTGRDSITIIDSACAEYLYIPTAFTPNHDLLNDIFKPTFAGRLLTYRFIIYNRWGKMIFSTKDFLRGWDGSLNGLAQPAGTYVWMCSYELQGMKPRTEKGTVTLIR